MSDKYDEQADQIVKRELEAYYVSPRPMSQRVFLRPFDLRAEIAAALRNMATENRVLASNLAILIAKMLDARDTDAAALEVAHITLRDPDMRAAIEEARVFWKRVKPTDLPADDVGGG